MLPTFMTPPTFLGTSYTSAEAKICIAGIPFDLGVTNRSGARSGPQAVRLASRMLADGDNPANWRNPMTLAFSDCGDFRIALGDIPASLAMIEEQAAQFRHLVAIGGDHTITLPLLRALNKRIGPVGLVHFDAHVDTWPDCFGQRLAHGSTFFHAINENLVDPRRMIQIGIRSPVDRAIHDWTIAKGVRIVTAEEVHESGPKAIAETISAVLGAGPAYMSFDIDAIDPGQAPGTGTPEIGGLFTWQTMAILKRLEGSSFVGMDVVEVSPPYDAAEITALAAAAIVWQYLSLNLLNT